MITVPIAVLLIWAGTAAWMDLLWRRVLWWWSLIGIVGAGGYRLASWLDGGFVPKQGLLIFFVVTAGYGLWKLNWWGGADAKMAMALVMLVPHSKFIALASFLIVLLSGVVLMVWGDTRRLRRLVSGVFYGLESYAMAPGDDRVPTVAMMSTSLVVYLYLTSFAL